MYKRKISQRLKWQAEGAQILKTCDVHCHITHDQSLLHRADTVVMEVYFLLNQFILELY